MTAARRRRRPGRRRASEAQALPLVNIVFLLLVFFMAAGRLAPPDPVALAPPASGQTGVDPAAPMTLALSADGQVFLDGAEVARDGLSAALRERVAEGAAVDVSVRADGGAPAAALAALLATLDEAGVGAARLIVVRHGR